MVQVQFGFGRFPLGAGGFGALLSSAELLLEALVQVPQFTRSHDCRVALQREEGVQEVSKPSCLAYVSVLFNVLDKVQEVPIFGVCEQLRSLEIRGKKKKS